MNFENIVKERNPVAYTIITNAIANNKVPHAYLFSAPEGKSVFNVPMFFIQKIISKNELRNPEHYSDLITIDGSNGLIKKDDVLKAIEAMQQTSLDSSGKKFLFIKNIENSNKQSVNSLLKFIEEPTKDTYILMTTNNMNAVLPTIKSRAQTINIKNDNIDDLTKSIVGRGIEIENARLIASIYASEEKALSIDKKEFLQAKELIIETMTNAINNPIVIISALTKEIGKKNYVLILNILREFINDIWRKNQLLKTSFMGQDELLEKYQIANFDFEKALKSINEFLLSQKFYVNFDLYKNKTLIEIKESYE